MHHLIVACTLALSSMAVGLAASACPASLCPQQSSKSGRACGAKAGATPVVGTDSANTAAPTAAVPVPLVGLYYFPKFAPGFDGLSDAEIADKLASMGINAVWGHERDAAFIDALHARGIKVFYTQAMGYGWENDVNRPVLENGALLDTFAPGHWYQGACPNDEVRIQRELDTIRDVLTNTKVDGVWLDSIRYPIYWEAPEPKLVQACFCPRCLEQFQRDTRITIPSEHTAVPDIAAWIHANYDQEWTEWRMMRITDKVKRVNQVVKAANPKSILGIFSVPWRRSDHNNAIERIIAQDFPNLANYVDVFSPMVYHRMVGEDVAWIHEIVKYMQAETGGRVPVVPVIQSINENSAWSTYTLESAEVGNATAAALQAPSQGVIVLTGADLFTNQHEKAFEFEVKKGLRK